MSQLQSSEQVQIDLNSYRWLTTMRFGLERPVEVLEPRATDLVPVAAASEVAMIVPQMKPATGKLKVRKPQRPRALKPQKRQAMDQVVTTAAAPRVVTEEEKMQQLHLFLRARLVASVRPDLGLDAEKVAGLDSQKTTQDQPKPEFKLAKAAPRIVVRKTIKRVKPTVVAAPAVALASTPATIAPEPALPKVITQIEISKPDLAFKVPTVDATSITTQAVTVATVPAQMESSASSAPSMTVPAPQPVAQPDLSSLRDRLLATLGGGSEPMSSQGSDQLVSTQSHASIQGGSSRNEYPSAGYSCPQSAEMALTTQPSPLDIHAGHIEAFSDDQASIHSATTEMLTSETLQTQGPVRGWEISHAPGHWPTLTRRSPNAVPLISENNARLLAAAVGARLETQAGIVFGRIADGWSVEFSGRAERMLQLSRDFSTVSPATRDGERYFVLMNAAPGAHLIQLTSRCAGETGAVGIMVMPGTATYLDFSRVARTQVNGRVLDAGRAEVKALRDITVGVLGSPLSSKVRSGRHGEFVLKDVLVVGDFPLFLETDTDPASLQGFVHRYERDPSKLKDVMLYRFGETQIQEWTSQLKGGISEDSGLLLALAPQEIIALHEPSPLFPKIETLASSATLEPETYALSAVGQLLVNSAVDPESPRVLGVQMPEGPALLRLESGEGRLAWSRLTVTSRGVVSIISP
ncbi:MAG: hypothetical protein NDJ89_07865 [Oligoflexia bacterium]|nr:hypothetical protein [Oligoflexia bacterium]